MFRRQLARPLVNSMTPSIPLTKSYNVLIHTTTLKPMLYSTECINSHADLNDSAVLVLCAQRGLEANLLLVVSGEEWLWVVHAVSPRRKKSHNDHEQPKSVGGGGAACPNLFRPCSDRTLIRLTTVPQPTPVSSPKPEKHSHNMHTPTDMTHKTNNKREAVLLL